MANKGAEEKMRLCLVDASGYAFRAYHATIRQGLSNSKGMPTGAVLVFTNMLLKLLREEKPTHVVVVWDPPGKTFRHEKYPEYKANRLKMPSDLGLQIPYMKRVVEAFNLPCRELAGYEADDVIGALARRAEKEDAEVVLVSGDKDLMQLVGERVTMLDTLKDTRTDVAAVKERFGVLPERVIDVLGLMGDSSDNVPGVRGIGEKTARKLMDQFGSMDEILAHADEIKGKVGEYIRDNISEARLSRELVTIVTDLPLEFEWDDFKPGAPDREALSELFEELEFNKLMQEFAADKVEISYEGYCLITDPAELEAFVERARKAGRVSVDTETTSLDPMRAELVGISMAVAEGDAVYVPVAHACVGSEKQIRWDRARELVGPLFADPAVEKIGQNLKYDYIVLRRAGADLSPIGFDTMVASYLINPRRRAHGLDDLAYEKLGHRMIRYEDVCGKGKNQISFTDVLLEEAMRYSCEDADAALRLERRFAPELEALGLRELFDEMEMPLLPVLARMEMAGVKVDTEILVGLSSRFEKEMAKLREKIFELSGREFNVDSPRQLGQVLFEELKLPAGKKTKTGYSTGVEVLTGLAEDHELPRVVLDYRAMAKLKSTYTDALVKLVHPHTGRIHTSYNQTVTSTGRLSSTDPNLQNIPVRTEEGRAIRQAFIGEGDNLIMSADYSQIELRLMAHYSREPALLEAFEKGEDIHARTAAEVFGVDRDQVTPNQRRQAKVINFGILYGMSAHGLTRQLDVDHRDAQSYIDRYFERYPGVRGYMDKVIEEARETGAVKTIRGRRLLAPEVRSSNYMARQAAEREAVNGPLQGSAADIIKLAMIEIDRVMRERGLDSRMIMQVHDELVFEVVPGEGEELEHLVREKMESAEKLAVPLTVDIGVGKNWAEAH